LVKMTKTELQVALAQATQTNKKTAGAFLDVLGRLRTAQKHPLRPTFGENIRDV